MKQSMRQSFVLGWVTARIFALSLNCSYPKLVSIASSGPRGFSGTATPTPMPASAISPKFVVTEALARKAFDDFELKGEKGQKINLGEEHAVSLTAQGPLVPLHKQQTLSLRFLSPLDQARKFGYEFGLVAKNRTPADRKDFEDRIVERIVGHSNQAVFIVKLLPVLFATDANEPIISFALLDRNENNIDPSERPDHYMASEKDLFDAVALEEDGQGLIFSVTNEGTPRITDQMEKMTLIVDVNGQQRKLDYRLKS